MSKRLLVGGLLGLIVVLAYLFGSAIVAAGFATHIANADYMNFLLGGAMLDQGQGHAATLYDIARQASVQQALTAPYGIRFHDGLLPFVSVPLVALLTAPLYNLPLPVGFALWDGVQLTALLLSLWLLGAMLPAANRYLLWLGGLAFLPLYASLTLGQVSPMLLLGVTLLWRGLRAGGAANWWSGAGLALLILKPQLLPLFLLYLLYKRNWRALGGFTITTVVVYLLSALISGFDWPLSYANILVWAGQQRDHYGFTPEAMFNLRGLLVRFAADNVVLLITLSALVVAALVYAWLSSDHSPTPTAVERVGTLELQLAATTIAATLTSLHLYLHDLTILIFSGAALLGWAAQRYWPVWMTALLLGVLLTALTFGSNYDVVFLLMLIVACAASLYLLPPARRQASVVQ